MVINPSLPDIERVRARPDRRRHEGGPDDGRGRRERGRRGEAARGARARPRRDQEALRGPGGAPEPRPASRSGSIPSSPRSSTAAHGERIARASRRRAPRGRGPVVELVEEPARRQETRRRTSSVDAGAQEPRRHPRAAPARGRRRSCPRAVRETSSAPSRMPSRIRRRSAPPSAGCSSTASSRRSSLPFPVGPATAEGEAPTVMDSLTSTYVKKAAEADLQGSDPEEDRRREDPPRRPRAPTRSARSHCEVGVSPAHARLGALHPRRDADHDAAHARHRQGGAAHRRPLPGVRAPLHAPLQLPALLGRGDGLHARPEAARHRPRRPCPARARAGDPDASTSSRTRSASSRRRSSRTARRRWAPSAARRSR